MSDHCLSPRTVWVIRWCKWWWVCLENKELLNGWRPTMHTCKRELRWWADMLVRQQLAGLGDVQRKAVSTVSIAEYRNPPCPPLFPV
jgi:hypothetical protein